MLRRPLALLGALVLLLAACGGASSSGTQSWRGLDVTLPEGWSAYDSRTDLFTASDSPLGIERTQEEATSIDPDENDVVALQFTYRPSVSVDRWRELVRELDGTIEVDEQIEVGGLPATSLVFSWVTNNVPTRERVVIVPPRQLELLFQPVPVQGQTSGPQVYLEHAEEFQAILDSITFGAPVDG